MPGDVGLLEEGAQGRLQTEREAEGRVTFPHGKQAGRIHFPQNLRQEGPPHTPTLSPSLTQRAKRIISTLDLKLSRQTAETLFSAELLRVKPRGRRQKPDFLFLKK